VKPKTPVEIKEDGEAFLRHFAFSVEDMIEHRLAPHYRYTSYRFFRSPNVIDLFKILRRRGGLRGRFRPK
jgi:hypothetical protein